MRHGAGALVAGFLAAAAAATGTDPRLERERWHLGGMPRAELPRLAAPLVPDGDLNEWAGAAAVPMRAGTYISRLLSGCLWRGPADLSATIYCAWNDEGLCLAAEVADDDVGNRTAPGQAWQQDCVEFFIDGRTGDRFLTAPRTAGFWQILVRPPLDSAPAAADGLPGHGQPRGLRIGGRLTGRGYTIELLVPWTNFPALRPETGAVVGIQFNLDDYDRRDGGVVQPRQMAWQGATALYRWPQKLIRWTLVESAAEGGNAPVSVLATLDLPTKVVAAGNTAVTIETGPRLAGARAVTARVRDWRGLVVWETHHGLRPAGRAAPGVWKTRLRWPHQGVPDGSYTFEVVFLDGRGVERGVAQRPFLLLAESIAEAHKAVDRTMTGVARVNWRHLAAERPFAAAAWCGALACAEKVKRAVEVCDHYKVLDATAELNARLAVLETGRVAEPTGALYRLLNLAAVPEAQVVVEYPWHPDDSDFQQQATVTFCWGPWPLAVCVARLAEGAATPHLALVTAQGKEVQARAVSLFEAGRPVTVAEVEALRAATVRALGATVEGAPPRDGRMLFTGDVHAHTFFSDGTPSPVGLSLEALYAFLDFNVITDHGTATGALLTQRLFRRYGFRYDVIAGTESGISAHLNMYPLRETLNIATPDLWEAARLAHAAGAVIQWNHPGESDKELFQQHGATGITGTELDAWEGSPGNMGVVRGASGDSPVLRLTGGTDSHDGAINSPQPRWMVRTVILAPHPSGVALADAVRSGSSLLYALAEPGLFFGPPEMVARARDALAEGHALKAQTARHLWDALQRAKPVKLLRASPTKRPATGGPYWPP